MSKRNIRSCIVSTLNGGIVAPRIEDCNMLNQSDLGQLKVFTVTPDTGNKPDPGIWGYLSHFQFNATSARQTIIPYFNERVIYQRRCENEEWRPWVMLEVQNK